jgi:hypothetical protein
MTQKIVIVDAGSSLQKAKLLRGVDNVINTIEEKSNMLNRLAAFLGLGNVHAGLDPETTVKSYYNPKNHFRYYLSRICGTKKGCAPTVNAVIPNNQTMTRQRTRAAVRDIVKSDVNRKFYGTMSRRARRGISHTIAGNYFRGIAQEAKATGSPLSFLFQKFAAQSAKARAAMIPQRRGQ